MYNSSVYNSVPYNDSVASHTSTVLNNSEVFADVQIIVDVPEGTILTNASL